MKKSIHRRKKFEKRPESIKKQLWSKKHGGENGKKWAILECSFFVHFLPPFFCAVSTMPLYSTP
jgi:hypothetical protein